MIGFGLGARPHAGRREFPTQNALRRLPTQAFGWAEAGGARSPEVADRGQSMTSQFWGQPFAEIALSRATVPPNAPDNRGRLSPIEFFSSAFSGSAVVVGYCRLASRVARRAVVVGRGKM